MTAPEPAVVPVPEPEAAEDPATVPSIAQAAADRLGITAPDEAADASFAGFAAAFAEDPAGDGDRAQFDATAVLPAADAAPTETVPAVTEGGQP